MYQDRERQSQALQPGTQFYVIRLTLSFPPSSRYHYGFVKTGNGNTFFHPKFHRDDADLSLSMERTNTPPTGLFSNSSGREVGQLGVMGSSANDDDDTSRKLPSVPGMISSTEVAVLGDRITESSTSAALHPNFGLSSLPKLFDAEHNEASLLKPRSPDWLASIENYALCLNPMLDSTLEPRPVEDMLSRPGALSSMIMKSSHDFEDT